MAMRAANHVSVSQAGPLARQSCGEGRGGGGRRKGRDERFGLKTQIGRVGQVVLQEKGGGGKEAVTVRGSQCSEGLLQ